jgi:putative CRISPR-associated protein (TIGR02619 family)
VQVIISPVGVSLLTNMITDLMLSNCGTLPTSFRRFLRAGFDANGELVTPGKVPDAVREDDANVVALKDHLLQTWLHDKVDTNTASAETKGIAKAPPPANGTVRLYFLATKSPACEACARALVEFYRGKDRYDVKEPVLLTKLSQEYFDEGLKELVNRIAAIIGEERLLGNDVIINATGGYKPEVAYATLTGILQGVRAFYIYEAFDKTVELPPLPVSFDLNVWHRHAAQVRLRQEGVTVPLPYLLEDLFQGNKLKPIGEVLWNAYQSSISGRGRVKPELTLLGKLTSDHQSRVAGFLSYWDSLWTGDQVTQMVDHQQNHCEDLLNLAEDALGPILSQDRDRLSEQELFYLVSAIFLHDIGHAEVEDASGQLLTLEQIRKRHAELTYRRIERDYAKLGFLSFDGELKDIATICKHHQRRQPLTEMPSDSESMPRLRLLTALLRVLDASDHQLNRVGEESYRDARLRANEQEKVVCERLLQTSPTGPVAAYLTDKVAFIAVQEEHFDLHSRIKYVHIETERQSSDGWTLLVKYYPVESGKGIPEYEEAVTTELDAECGYVRKLLLEHGLAFQVARA